MNKHQTHNTKIIKTRYNEYKFYCTECAAEFATTNRKVFTYYNTELRIPTSYNLIVKLTEKLGYK